MNGFWKCSSLAVVLCLLAFSPVGTCAETMDAAEVSDATESSDGTEDISGSTEISADPVLSKKTLEIKKGKSKTLSVKNAAGTVKWSSSNKKIASVSSAGVVTGNKCGIATISAKLSRRTLTCRVKVYASKKYVDKWVKTKGFYYYYNAYGEKLTGTKTIGKKTYRFDKDGRQRVGWIKSKGKYYYYKTTYGKKGALVTGSTINGIRLGKKGAAKATSANKEKLRLLVAANNLVFENTTCTMSKEQKLKTMYKGLATGELIIYKNLGSFKKSSPDWAEIYAASLFDKGYGDCYTAGCAFAYIAAAIGYSDVYAESSGGHGWCRIGDCYYDPNWAWWGADNIMDVYAVPSKLSGTIKGPNWARQTAYSKKVS